MDFDSILMAAPGIGVGLGLLIHFSRQRRINARIVDTIRSELRTADSLTLPELVTRCGLRDGFLNRGTLMNAINPLVAAGELVQEEPPGTTIRNRLSVLRFRLNK